MLSGTNDKMRLAVAAVLVLAVAGHAAQIDLFKPVEICSGQMLLEVISKVCQTPMTLASRRRRRSFSAPTALREFADTCCYRPCKPSIFIEYC